MIPRTVTAVTLLLLGTAAAEPQKKHFAELIPVATQPTNIVGPLGPFVTTRIYLDDVELTGISIEGLELEREYIEYRDGNIDQPARNVQGIPKYPNITLKRARLSADDILRSWARVFHLPSPDARPGPLTTKALRIDILAGENRIIERIELKGCWPRKFMPFTTLPPQEGALITESITLSCDEATSDDGPFFVPSREIRRRER